MSRIFSGTVDVSAATRAMANLAPAIERRTHPASRVTADNIAREGRARVRRRTGETAEGIIVQEDEDGIGHVVLSINRSMPNLPIWIERGTEHVPASPYFDPAAELERGPHRRRIEQAIVDAIAEVQRG